MRRCLLLACFAGLLCAGAARADGDPASDWLITKQAFIPPDAGVPPAYSNQLGAVLADAKARGFEVRVAVIASRYDLGAIPIVFHRPKQYAPFLSKEVLFAYRGRILTVMSNGYGIARNGNAVPAEQAILDRLPRPGASGPRMAAGASRAVVSLAAHAGIVIPLPPLGGSTPTSSTSHDRLIIFVAVLAVAAATGVVWLLRRRSRATTA
ncbi:MAG TPA: hypothetical protein VFA05_11275 [Gaiellaceae bacterium]|nr:hypothetical protein [Gaiellaceae bacterium]